MKRIRNLSIVILALVASAGWGQGYMPKVGTFTKGPTNLPLHRESLQHWLNLGYRLADPSTLKGSLTRQQTAAKQGHVLKTLSLHLPMDMWHGGDKKLKKNYIKSVSPAGNAFWTWEEPVAEKEVRWIEQNMLHIITIRWWEWLGHQFCVNTTWEKTYGVTVDAKSYPMSVVCKEPVIEKIVPCAKATYIAECSEAIYSQPPSFTPVVSTGFRQIGGATRTTTSTCLPLFLPRGRWSGNTPDPTCVDIWNRPPLPL